MVFSGNIKVGECLIDSRPTSQSGRPLSGFVRPGTQSAQPGTMEQALRTPRTAHTARPVTATSGRFVRLGTVSSLPLCCLCEMFDCLPLEPNEM